MFRRGILTSQGSVRSRPRKRYVDSGRVKHTSPKSSEKVPVSVPVQECETSPEEDAEFVKELMEEFKEDYPESSNISVEPDESQEEVIPEPVVEEIPEMEETYYVVIDFEATCFKGRRVPHDETEIIEFASVIVNKETLLVVDEFDMFVRPTIHPELDAFCTELTSITQEQVDGGYTFPTVLRQFTNWMEQYKGDRIFCAWGDYDKKQLVMECERHGLVYPFDDEYINIKKLFSSIKGYRRKYGLGTALRRLKMEFQGTPHRGIDDTRNIVRIMQEILTEPS